MTKKRSHNWTIRADRRTIDLERLIEEIRALGETLAGVDVTLADRSEFETAPDAGAFRDFIPVATASADDDRVLEALAEELLLEFGFQVDFVKS